jgi:hypothetical protein
MLCIPAARPWPTDPRGGGGRPCAQSCVYPDRAHPDPALAYAIVMFSARRAGMKAIERTAINRALGVKLERRLQQF